MLQTGPFKQMHIDFDLLSCIQSAHRLQLAEQDRTTFWWRAIPHLDVWFKKCGEEKKTTKNTHRKKTTRTPLQTGDRAETRHHITVVKSKGKECWSWASGEMLITSLWPCNWFSYSRLLSKIVQRRCIILCRRGRMKRNPLKKAFF